MDEVAESKPRACFEFEIEKILGVSDDGRYRVQWAPAWVSKFHLVGCKNLIQEFLQQQAGREIKPDPEDRHAVSEIRNETMVNIHEDCFDIPQSEDPQEVLFDGSTAVEYKSQPEVQDDNIVGVFGDGAMWDSCPLNGVAPPFIKVESESVPQISQCPVVSDNQCVVPIDQLSIISNCSTAFVKELTESCNQLQSSGASDVQQDNISPPVISTKPSTEYSKGTNRKRQSHGKNFGDRGLECTYCKKKFKKNSKLVLHIRTHTGEKPFRCHLCDYACSVRSNLARHMRKHTCSVCGSTFSLKSDLTEHFRTHAIHPS